MGKKSQFVLTISVYGNEKLSGKKVFRNADEANRAYWMSVENIPTSLGWTYPEPDEEKEDVVTDSLYFSCPEGSIFLECI